jgi:hypothetical protein
MWAEVFCFHDAKVCPAREGVNFIYNADMQSDASLFL